MPKDTKTLGNSKARACESLGFVHKKGCARVLTQPLFISKLEYNRLAINSFFFNSCFLTGKSTQIVQFSATNFTHLVHLDAIDSR